MPRETSAPRTWRPLLWRAAPVAAFRCSTSGLPVLAGLIVAMRWGLASAGHFAVASAAITVAATAADWGASRALPRELALRPDGEESIRFLARANSVRLLVALVTVGVLAALGATLGVKAPVAIDFALLLPVLPLSLLANNAVSARLVAAETAAVGLAGAAGVAAFALAAAAAWSLPVAHGMAVAVGCGKAAELAVLIHGRLHLVSLRTDHLCPTFVALWPYAAQILLGVLYARLAVFTLERLATAETLGVFAVAASLQSVLLLLPSSLGLLIFPELSRLAHRRDVGGTRAALRRYARAAAGGICLGLLGLAALLRPIAKVFHVPMAQAPFLVAFSAIALLAVFSTICGFLLQAWGEERRAAKLSLATLALAFVFHVVAVESLGLWGVVVAGGAAEVSSILLFATAVRHCWTA